MSFTYSACSAICILHIIWVDLTGGMHGNPRSYARRYFTNIIQTYLLPTTRLPIYYIRQMYLPWHTPCKPNIQQFYYPQLTQLILETRKRKCDLYQLLLFCVPTNLPSTIYVSESCIEFPTIIAVSILCKDETQNNYCKYNMYSHTGCIRLMAIPVDNLCL